MSAEAFTAPLVLTVGDGIVDEVVLRSGRVERHPGGAALNLAVGMARLGLDSTLVFNVGQDRDGDLIRSYLREHQVHSLELPSTLGTGLARSIRDASDEAVYVFNEAIHSREFRLGPAVLAAAEDSHAVAVTAFPLDKPQAVEHLVATFESTRGLKAIDPNPRPSLLTALTEFRGGFLRAARHADLIKLSDADVGLLELPQVTLEELRAGGAAVVVTHGAGGVTAMLPTGDSIWMPIARDRRPIVDTLGAGDATLASLIAHLIPTDSPQLAEQSRPTLSEWRSALVDAMANAAATCRAVGGLLRTPEPLDGFTTQPGRQNRT